MTRIQIENVLQPGKTYPVDAAKFGEMGRVMLQVMPPGPPGMTPKDLFAKVKPLLDQTLFPNGEKAGWWVKAVQLDGEAKGRIVRADMPPVRLWRA
jgi:hypothetical protein